MTKFQILSYPRTGSTLLNDILNRHSDIKSWGEIFHANIIAKNPDSIIGRYGLHDRYYRVIDFLEKFYNSMDSKCVGYKYILGTWNWTVHNIKNSEFGFPEEIISDKTIKRIVLSRKNILQAVVSYQIASKNNEWVVTEGNIPADINFEIPVDVVRFYIDLFLEKHDAWVKYLTDNGHDVYYLAYEDISLKTVNEILDFLECDNIDEIKTSLTKINTPDRYDQILNKDELNNTFKEYGKL